jgi:hypothetical protein
VQTVAEDNWIKPDEAQPVAMVYDGTRKRLVTGVKRPYLWEHKLVMRDASGHRGAVVKAIYNSTFYVVVSADESASNLMSWRRYRATVLQIVRIACQVAPSLLSIIALCTLALLPCKAFNCMGKSICGKNVGGVLSCFQMLLLNHAQLLHKHS